jgi:hypothetical protein
MVEPIQKQKFRRAKSKPRPIVKTTKKANPMIKTKTNTKPKTNPIVKTKTKTNPKTNPIVKTKTKTKPKTNPIVKTKTKTKPKTNPIVKTKPNQMVKTKTNLDIKPCSDKRKLYDITINGLIGSLIFAILSLPQASYFYRKIIPGTTNIDIYKEIGFKSMIFSILYVTIVKNIDLVKKIEFNKYY